MSIFFIYRIYILEHLFSSYIYNLYIREIYIWKEIHTHIYICIWRRCLSQICCPGCAHAAVLGKLRMRLEPFSPPTGTPSPGAALRRIPGLLDKDAQKRLVLEQSTGMLPLFPALGKSGVASQDLSLSWPPPASQHIPGWSQNAYFPLRMVKSHFSLWVGDDWVGLAPLPGCSTKVDGVPMLLLSQRHLLLFPMEKNENENKTKTLTSEITENQIPNK